MRKPLVAKPLVKLAMPLVMAVKLEAMILNKVMLKMAINKTLI